LFVSFLIRFFCFLFFGQEKNKMQNKTLQLARFDWLVLSKLDKIISSYLVNQSGSINKASFFFSSIFYCYNYNYSLLDISSKSSNLLCFSKKKFFLIFFLEKSFNFFVPERRNQQIVNRYLNRPYRSKNFANTILKKTRTIWVDVVLGNWKRISFLCYIEKSKRLNLNVLQTIVGDLPISHNAVNHCLRASQCNNKPAHHHNLFRLVFLRKSLVLILKFKNVYNRFLANKTGF
jgi:hypothetical protein